MSFAQFEKQPLQKRTRKRKETTTTGDGKIDPESTYAPIYDTLFEKNKYKVGDLVHVALDYPENALGHKQDTAQFREGDARYSKFPRIVKAVLPYDEGYRYLTTDKKGKTNYRVSYRENELIPAKKSQQAVQDDDKEEEPLVELSNKRPIFARRDRNNQIQYRLNFKDGTKEWRVLDDDLWTSFRYIINQFHELPINSPRGNLPKYNPKKWK